MDFYQTLTNGLAQGKTLTAVCDSAKLHLLEVQPFSISTRDVPEVEDHVTLNQYKQLSFTTPLGKVSNFQMTSEGGRLRAVPASACPQTPQGCRRRHAGCAISAAHRTPHLDHPRPGHRHTPPTRARTPGHLGRRRDLQLPSRALRPHLLHAQGR